MDQHDRSFEIRDVLSEWILIFLTGYGIVQGPNSENRKMTSWKKCKRSLSTIERMNLYAKCIMAQKTKTGNLNKFAPFNLNQNKILLRMIHLTKQSKLYRIYYNVNWPNQQTYQCVKFHANCMKNLRIHQSSLKYQQILIHIMNRWVGEDAIVKKIISQSSNTQVWSTRKNSCQMRSEPNCFHATG